MFSLLFLVTMRLNVKGIGSAQACYAINLAVSHQAKPILLDVDQLSILEVKSSARPSCGTCVREGDWLQEVEKNVLAGQG